MLVSEQPCEADQILWMGGKGVGTLGMVGPTHNHGAFDVQMNGTSSLLPSAVPICFWERELTHPGSAVFVMVHAMSCFDLPEKKGSVPTPIRMDPGRVGLATMLEEMAKLRRIRGLALPDDLFPGIACRVLAVYRNRASIEGPSRLRAHASAKRLTYLAALDIARRYAE